MELYVNRKQFRWVHHLVQSLLNITMTELDRVIVEPLLTSGKIKFYARYVNDTLLLAKEEDINLSLTSLLHFIKILNLRQIVLMIIYIFWTQQSIKTKPTYTTNTLILVKILTLKAMFHGIIKFHELNPFTTKQKKFAHQEKSLGFKLTR